MTELLGETLALWQSTLFWGFIVFLRVGAAMMLFPAFGEQTVPVRVRLAVAVSFTLIVAPAIIPDLMSNADTGAAKYFVTEAIVGLAIGFVVRLFIITLQVAGSVAAQSTSLSQLFGGVSAEPSPAIGNVLVLAGLALAVTTGLHVRLAELLLVSYQVFPAGEFPLADLLVDWEVARIAQAFGMGFALAAPFVIASLIYNVALGVINRAMPQLMVAFVGAPAITAGGLILLMLTAPYLLSVWIEALNGFLSAPFGGS